MNYKIFPHVSRLRLHPVMRKALKDVVLRKEQLIQPIFIHEGLTEPKAIKSMPGQFQYSLNTLEKRVSTLLEKGVSQVILFGVPLVKDQAGQRSCEQEGFMQRAFAMLKPYADSLITIADVCLCEYTSQGHCGIVAEEALSYQRRLNITETRKVLTKQALSYARAGASVVAPSAMCDGLTREIRETLDSTGFEDVPILAYSSKYASNLYGPFRDAGEGAPQGFDRSSYQMDFQNSHEYALENNADVVEGADMLMVKPAGYYLDIVARTKAEHPATPLVGYQVSGEYSMLKQAIMNKYLPAETVFESLCAIRRAGADAIITYFAEEVAAQCY